MMTSGPSSSTLSFGRAPGAAGRTDALRKATTRKEGEPCGTPTVFYLAAAGPLASSPPVARRDPLSSRARCDYSTPSREHRDPRQGTSAHKLSRPGALVASHDAHPPSADSRLCAPSKTGCSRSAHGPQRGSPGRCVRPRHSPETNWSRLDQQGPQDPRIPSSPARPSLEDEPRLAFLRPARGSEQPDARHVRGGALPVAPRSDGVTDEPCMQGRGHRRCHGRTARIKTAAARPPARMRGP
jgi:hypothetical protein